MTQHQVDELIKKYPVPSEAKLLRHIGRLERMIKFYEVKLPETPEKTAEMFSGFVAALLYARTIIKIHRSLTQTLAALTEKEEK